MKIKNKITRVKELKTGWPDKRRLAVRVVQSKDFVRISTLKEFDFLKNKAPQNKFGAELRNGQFFITCPYKKYADVIQKLTKYLEDIIFNQMVEKESADANKNSGNDSNTRKTGNSKSDTANDNGENKKEKSGSVLSGIFGSSNRDK